jgi:hypothetical protein
MNELTTDQKLGGSNPFERAKPQVKGYISCYPF